MVKRLLLAASLVWSPAVILLSGCGSEASQALPAPAPSAPQNALQQEDRTLGLPLEITIENVPEVPEELLGPSPPIAHSEG